ncbi:MAG: chromate transporter [Clostridia bacterium]|nr:chromate transporter [Clostridia bacterium]
MMEYLRLFYIFFKVGLCSFGGGYAMLSPIYQEIKQLSLISEREFSNIVALSQMTPGPIAVNAATYVGYKSAGFWGSVFATIGVSLPSFILILIISAFFYKFKTNPIVQGVLSGIRPATVGMIASAVIFLSQSSIFSSTLSIQNIKNNPSGFINIPAVIIFIITIICTKKFKIGPIPLTIFAGVLGIFIL